MANFYFYDLETSGVNPRTQRVMQFAGQKTNAKLEPIGEMDDLLIKLDNDILPEPMAILTHGVTPQKANQEGLYERQFLEWFHDQVLEPDLIIVGYNSVRFDDEFIRNMHYRNFYDPYEWQWQQGRSKWDLLDATRMCRALRPDGIVWPFNTEGNPSNRLEDITRVNDISHEQAHTAGSDVLATIEVAKMLRSKSPKLFDYLLSVRDKKSVNRLVDAGNPFVYTSGSLASEFSKTTVMVSLGPHPKVSSQTIIYDLRFDPEDLAGISPAELSKRIFVKRGSEIERLPAKILNSSHCPAVAPLGVLDDASWQRIGLDLSTIESNFKALAASDLSARITEAFALQYRQSQSSLFGAAGDVDSQIYDGFYNDRDKVLMSSFRQHPDNVQVEFEDQRLQKLKDRYFPRQFPEKLTSQELQAWDDYRRHKLLDPEKGDLKAFEKQFEQAAQTFSGQADKEYLLTELQLYVQSIMPDTA